MQLNIYSIIANDKFIYWIKSPYIKNIYVILFQSDPAICVEIDNISARF